MTQLIRNGIFLSALTIGVNLSGCAHHLGCKRAGSAPACDAVAVQSSTSGAGCQSTSDDLCESEKGRKSGNAWNQCKTTCSTCSGKLCGCWFKKSNAVPETLPLGSTLRAYDQVMETNAEASDFIIHRHDFETQTARLTSDGRDQLMEIAARMSNTPFPVIIERSENNSDPELDALRRDLIARILFDLGHEDAQQRTNVAPAYGPGYSGQRAEWTYYQHIGIGNNNFNNNSGVGGNFGGGTLNGSGTGAFGNF